MEQLLFIRLTLKNGRKTGFRVASISSYEDEKLWDTAGKFLDVKETEEEIKGLIEIEMKY